MGHPRESRRAKQQTPLQEIHSLQITPSLCASVLSPAKCKSQNSLLWGQAFESCSWNAPLKTRAITADRGQRDSEAAKAKLLHQHKLQHRSNAAKRLHQWGHSTSAKATCPNLISHSAFARDHIATARAFPRSLAAHLCGTHCLG